MFETLLATAILVLGLVVNRMVSNWHDETIAAFKKDEERLRQQLASAVKEQKKVLIDLRKIKVRIVNCESMLEDRQLDDKSE